MLTLAEVDDWLSGINGPATADEADADPSVAMQIDDDEDEDEVDAYSSVAMRDEGEDEDEDEDEDDLFGLDAVAGQARGHGPKAADARRPLSDAETIAVSLAKKKLRDAAVAMVMFSTPMSASYYLLVFELAEALAASEPRWVSQSAALKAGICQQSTPSPTPFSRVLPPRLFPTLQHTYRGFLSYMKRLTAYC